MAGLQNAEQLERAERHITGEPAPDLTRILAHERAGFGLREACGTDRTAQA